MAELKMLVKAYSGGYLVTTEDDSGFQNPVICHSLLAVEKLMRKFFKRVTEK